MAAGAEVGVGSLPHAAAANVIPTRAALTRPNQNNTVHPLENGWAPWTLSLGSYVRPRPPVSCVTTLELGLSVDEHERHDARLVAAVDPVVDRRALHEHITLLQVHLNPVAQRHVELA